MQKVEFISFERQKVRFKHFFHQKYMLIPAHRPEAYALTKKYARMETALLQTFVVHYISSMFPMEQLHCRVRLAHKYIHVTISRLQTHLPDLPTHTIHAHAHISMMLRHNYMVVLIQIEHNFLRDKGKQSRRNGKGGWFRMVAAFLHTISPHATHSSHGGWFGYCLWAGAYSSPAPDGRLFISVGLVDVFPHIETH